MRKIFCFLILYGLFIYEIQAQTVTNKQYMLVSKVTADWCPKCGDYGWSIFKELEKEYKDKNVLVLAIHKSSSGLKTKSSETIANTLGGVGQPLYFINDAEKEGINSDNWKTKLNEIVDDVNLLSAGSTAFLGVNTEVELKENGKYRIKIKAKAFDNINNGVFYAGVYLVNDNLVAPQASQSSQAKHTGVLRENILGEDLTFGVQLLNAPIINGTEASFEKDDVEIKIGNQSPADFRIVTVLWNKRADKYVFNNAAVSDFSAIISNNEEIEKDQFEVRYNISDKAAEVIDTKGLLIEAKTELFNVSGQIIPVHILSKEASSLRIDLNHLTSGTYFLRVSLNNRVQSQALIIP